MSPQLTAWLFDSIVLFIQVSVAAVFLFGVLLVIAPRLGIAVQRGLSRPFSGRRASRPLELPVNIEPFFYRHARTLGVVLILGAMLMLWLNAQLPGQIQAGSPALWAWLAESLYWFLWLAGVAIFLVGLACLVRPSLLKPLEARANHWVSTRQQSRFLSQEHTPLDHFLVAYPRPVGAVISVVSGLLSIILLRI